jgi:NTP pyrophosphatase (non-canonical NTP hydrolase)
MAKTLKITDDMTTLAGISLAVYRMAARKGFHSPHDTEDQFVERACNNLHDEVSELHDAWRTNQLDKLCDKAEDMQAKGLPAMTCAEEELADIVIRALDTAYTLGVDIQQAIECKHAYNLTRPHRYGGKKS